MNKLFVITGASGAGKTTTVKNIEEGNLSGFVFCYFDSVGVPSFEEMVEKNGSTEEWQRLTTEKWIKKIIEEYLPKSSVVFDGQMRPSFIVEACKKYSLDQYEIVLFDCSNEVRKERLISRGHPELAQDHMMNWAKHLREEAGKLGCKIIDNTSLLMEESKVELLKVLGKN